MILSNFKTQYEKSINDGNKLGFITAVFFFLSFIGYARFMVTSGLVPFKELEPFPTIVVALGTIVAAFFFTFVGYSLSNFIAVLVSFFKSSVKKTDDYKFFIDETITFFLCFTCLALYHHIVMIAHKGFGFYQTIIFIMCTVVLATLTHTFVPKLVNFLVSFIEESETLSVSDKKEFVKTSFQKKPKSKKHVIEIGENEVSNVKNVLHSLRGISFSDILTSLTSDINYIHTNLSYLTELDDRYIFKRIIGQDIMNLIHTYTALEMHDQKNYQDNVLKELGQVSIELSKMRNKINEIKRSHIEKSLLLSKERYS